MRQKTRRLPGKRRGSPIQAAEPTPDWVIENELGWGLPHAAIAAIAIVVVGVRVIGWELDRVEAWLVRLRRSGSKGGPAR